MSLPHENLVAWQRADDLFIDVHRLTLQRFPPHERYELGSPMRRAAWSVPSNIVEGSARQSRRERLRFYDFARASPSELGYGVHAAGRLGYIDDKTRSGLEDQIRLVAAPLTGLMAKYRLRVALEGAGVVALVGALTLFW